jgi:hypothetical protein
VADTKISALTALSPAAVDDLLAIVDISDTTMAATGTTKNIQVGDLFSPARLKQIANGSPSDGDLWYGSSQKTIDAFLNGLRNRLVGCIFTQTSDVTVQNTTVETSLVGSGVGTLVIPANWWVVGKAIRISAGGTFTTTASPPNWNFKVYLGSTLLGQTGGSATPASQTASRWFVDFDIVCRAIGASGSLMGVGRRTNEAPGASSLFAGLGGSAVTVDTTSQQTLDLRLSLGTVVASNTFTCSVLDALVKN